MSKNRSYLDGKIYFTNEIPRVKRLLEEGLSYPLTTIVAGPGYGKTQRVKELAKEFSGTLVYLSLSGMDNNATVFWENLIRAASREQPALARRLRTISLPETLMEFTTFYKCITKEIYTGKQVLFVLDNYCWLESPEVLRFVSYLCSIELENFSLFIIGQSYPSVIPDNAKVFRITARSLAFTVSEIEKYFRARGISQQCDYQEIREKTGGWPFAVERAAFEAHESIERYGDLRGMTLSYSPEIFAKSFFEPFGEDVKQLLIRLSLLPQFDRTLAGLLCEGCDKQEIEESIEKNSMINYHTSGDAYTFQKAYKDFLVSKQDILTGAQREFIFNTAAKHFAEKGKWKHAITCYCEGGRYSEAARIMRYTLENEPASAGHKKHENAGYYMGLFEKMPRAVLDSDAFLQLIFASVLVICGEKERALELCRSIEKRLSGKTGAGDRLLLGEMYLVMSEAVAGGGGTGFLDCQIKARELLPEGSKLKNKSFYAVGNNGMLFLPLLRDEKTGELKTDGRAGMLDSLVEEFAQAQPLMVKNMNGFTGGMAFLFAAEAAYHTQDFAKAERMAYKAIYDAKKYQQYDIFCNAQVVLVKIAFARGRVKEAQEHIGEISRLIEQNRLNGLFDLRDCINSWFMSAVGRPENSAAWLKNGRLEERQILEWYIGRDMDLYAGYLLDTRQNTKLLAFLDYYGEVAERLRKWLSILNVHIMRAICHYRLGETENAAADFRRAYDMSYNNGIAMPFIEFNGNIRSLLKYLSGLENSGMDTEWISMLYKKASTHAKRLSFIAKEYERMNAPVVDTVSLSKREAQVLKALSQGLTREEIAHAYDISLGTVKKYITSLYAKLGAINRADAIFIAANKGLLD